jgi:succinate dehydrogenase/fumarate reductase flavoprotein subunit
MEGVILEFDVVVVGSGAAGMTAAIVATDAKLTVCVLEKTNFFGGATAYSGGGANIPNNHHMKAMGSSDNRGDAQTYYRELMGNLFDAKKIDAFVDNAPKMLAYMENNTEVKFSGPPTPDYEPWRKGTAIGRQVFAEAYDGTRLGKNLNLLRRPWPQLGLLGDMQIRTQEIYILLSMFRSFASFKIAAGLFTRHFVQKLLHGRGTRLCMGNALAGRLFKSAIDRNVTLLNNTPALSLEMVNGAVAGVLVERQGKEETILARKGVVLACGGFGVNQQLREQCFPNEHFGPTLAPDGSNGDGIRMGVETGAVFVTQNIHNGVWVPVSTMTTKDGKNVNFPHLALDRHSTGTLTVERSGRRFVNEGSNYQLFCDVMHAQGIKEAYIIAGHKFVRKTGLGMVRPAPMPLTSYLRSGYLIRGQTLADLAGQLGVDVATFAKTVETFNTYATKGHDLDFKRGDDIYSARLSGGGGSPNPALAPLGDGPYYAIKIRAGDLDSMCGLDTNEFGQVLNSDKHVIAGLYAAGINANSIFRGAYPTGGSSIGPAMTFGYIAARHLAGLIV